MENILAKLATLLSEWSEIMKKIKPLNTQTPLAGLLIIAALALPGCVADDLAADDGVRTPVQASDNYPITLTKGAKTLDVASNDASLSPQQIDAVRGFVNQATSAGVTPLTVTRPSGGGNSARVASEIASLMVSEGVARNAVNFRVYKAASTAPVRVSFISTYAATKPCGDWSKDLADTSDNTSYPNLGCAVQADLAAMIADPNTVIFPKTIPARYSNSDVAAANRSSTFVNTTNMLSNYSYHTSP